MTGQELYDQAMLYNQTEEDVETLRQRLLTGPKTGPELWSGFNSTIRKSRVQNAFLRAGFAEYVGKHWRLKRKPLKRAS